MSLDSSLKSYASLPAALHTGCCSAECHDVEVGSAFMPWLTEAVPLTNSGSTSALALGSASLGGSEGIVGGSAAPRERVVSRSTGTVPWNRVGRSRQDSVATPRYGDRAEPPVEASLDLPMPSSLASSTLSGAPHRGGLNGGR